MTNIGILGAGSIQSDTEAERLWTSIHSDQFGRPVTVQAKW